MQLGRKKFILRMWSLMPEQSEGKNRRSKIMFFILAGHKVHFIASFEANNPFYDSSVEKKILWNTGKTFIFPSCRICYFLCCTRFFFHLGVEEWIFSPRGQKNALFDPLIEKIIYLHSSSRLKMRIQSHHGKSVWVINSILCN